MQESRKQIVFYLGTCVYTVSKSGTAGHLFLPSGQCNGKHFYYCIYQACALPNQLLSAATQRAAQPELGISAAGEGWDSLAGRHVVYAGERDVHVPSAMEVF